MPEFTNPDLYQEEADRTKCDQLDALDRINEGPAKAIVRKMSLLHGIIGLMGELGELAADVERYLWYGQPFNKQNFLTELGDSQWYLAELHNALDVSMLEVMRANIRKLRSRYPEKFDQELAKEENRNREEEMKATIKEIKTGPITSRRIDDQELKTSEEWEKYFDAKVIDPDGWRWSGDDNRDFSDSISKEEFTARWYLSTCKQPPKGELKEMVDVLSQRSFKSIGEAISILQANRYAKDEYLVPDETIAKIKGDANIRVQQTFSGIRSAPKPGEPLFLQTGQGFAEPIADEDEPFPIQDLLDQVWEPDKLITKEQIDKALEGQDSFAMKDFKGFPPALGSEEFYQSMGVPPEVFKASQQGSVENPVDPPYLYGKSRDARTGTNSVGKGFIRQLESVEEADLAIGKGFPMAVDPSTSLNDLRKSLKQDPEPEDGWTVARKIATTFVDGQNLAYALKSIDSFEEQWNTALREGKVETEKDRLARTGILALVALRLDLNNTPPIKVEEEIKNLKSLVNR